MATARAATGPEVVVFLTTHHDTYPAISTASADLSGKSVFISGASKGVGRATAASFAAAGCSKIAIGARSGLDEVEAEVRAAAAAAGRPEPQVLCLQLDVTSEESVKAAAEAVRGAFGGVLDTLVNNAGYNDPWVPLMETNPTEWWTTWEVSIKGAYLCARYLLPLLLASETKLLINVASVGALMLNPGASAYQAAKFAMCRLSEHIENDYKDQGLLAVSIHPGGVATELGLTMPKQMHRFLTDTATLAGDAMVWLARERREWLSGRYMSVNWDVDELVAMKDEIVEKDSLKFRMAL